MLLFNCGALQLANTTYPLNPNQNPGLLTLLELIDLPNFNSLCKQGPNGPVPK
jgi:hypothetical protein